MEEIMLKVDRVSKQYILGQIGETTLRDDLQRLSARRHGKEDPTKMIGEKEYGKNERFLALDDVSFEVRRGERVGIIGQNGAGKSTLLKLISRVTAPTSGMIGLNGRVASMLEVGTGFHQELTGRENIYMNGAILGMTRKEIDTKIDDIIAFSECSRFIDTPVKRYSSGMYVKLAFSVAAHLDSEIMIMDEVLAVGDMAFQKKCLTKMSDVSRSEGRTILYVSHNMNTIRQLCERVIVLHRGKIQFDGDVEEGIGVYLGERKEQSPIIEYQREHHRGRLHDSGFEMKKLRMLDTDTTEFACGSRIALLLYCQAKQALADVFFRFEIKTQAGTAVGTVFSDGPVDFEAGEKDVPIRFDLTHLAPGAYCADIVAFQKNDFGQQAPVDAVCPGMLFSIRERENGVSWMTGLWGPTHLHDLRIEAGADSPTGLPEALARISRMEALFDRLSLALRNTPERIETDAELRAAAGALADYQASGDWLRDYELDEQGMLPAALKRGVLSQDALYELLCSPEIEAVLAQT